MNKKQYSERDFQMCMDLLDYLEDEMEYRMCSEVLSGGKMFHKMFPQRGDRILTNIQLTIKRVGLEKMKSDVSQFLKYYNKYLSNQTKWTEQSVIG
mgnify:CR=1 FL=1